MLMLRICHYPVLNKSKIAIGSQMLEDWSCDMLPLDWALWLRSCSVVAACCCCIDRTAVCPHFQRISTASWVFSFTSLCMLLWLALSPPSVSQLDRGLWHLHQNIGSGLSRIQALEPATLKSADFFYLGRTMPYKCKGLSQCSMAGRPLGRSENDQTVGHLVHLGTPILRQIHLTNKKEMKPGRKSNPTAWWPNHLETAADWVWWCLQGE
jgi:hypothetical protein